MAFQAIGTRWLTTKRAATLTSPQGRGARTCKENHHCTMAFQAIATHWLTTKRAATLTSPQERGGANLQGKSSLCYGFPSHSNP